MDSVMVVGRRADRSHAGSGGAHGYVELVTQLLAPLCTAKLLGRGDDFQITSDHPLQSVTKGQAHARR